MCKNTELKRRPIIYRLCAILYPLYSWLFRPSHILKVSSLLRKSVWATREKERFFSRLPQELTFKLFSVQMSLWCLIWLTHPKHTHTHTSISDPPVASVAYTEQVLSLCYNSVYDLLISGLFGDNCFFLYHFFNSKETHLHRQFYKALMDSVETSQEEMKCIRLRMSLLTGQKLFPRFITLQTFT